MHSPASPCSTSMTTAWTVSRSSVGLGFSAQHQGDDQPDLDHGDGERQHQGPERLAHPERHHLGMVDGRDHVAQQRRDQHQRERLETHLADQEPSRHAEHRQDDRVQGNAIDGSAGHTPSFREDIHKMA